MKKQNKSRRCLAWLLSMAMVITLMPLTVFAAANGNTALMDAGTEANYVLMNIPYADFYAGETGVADAITSATKNGKARNVNVNGASYHQNEAAVTEEGIAGAMYPVKVMPADLEVLRENGAVEVTDTSKVEYEMNARGQISTVVLEGVNALQESPSYSYYVLSEEPAAYKELTIQGGSVSFSKAKGTPETAELKGAETGGTHADVEISFDGLDVVPSEVSAVVVTAGSQSYALHHVVNIWRGVEIGWNYADINVKASEITNVRYFMKNGTIRDYTTTIPEAGYVLMNVPYADFYQAELGENGAVVDAVTSSTLNKPRTGTLAGGSYHVNADGSDISGVIYPVFVKDLSQLDGLTEVTDESSVDITVTNRGQETTTTYSGKDALFESADYSYYKLKEKPARYKKMTVSDDGAKSFSAVSGRATTVNDASGEVNEAGHHADVEIVLSNTTGIEQGQNVSGVVVTFEDESKVGLRHIAELWRATQIGGSAAQFADKKITNVRYYTQDSVIDFPMEIAVKKKAAAATAEFTDASTIEVTGLPEDLENAKATVQSKVGRGETPTVIAEDVDVIDGVIKTTDDAENSKTYTVAISSDNYLRISVDADSPRPEGEDFLSELIGEYQPLFEGATLNSEYDHYWHDYTAAVVGESFADDTVDYLKNSINAGGYGADNEAPNFYCGFVNDVATITFGGEDGKTVTFTREDGSSVTHTYDFVEEAAATGKYGEYDMAMSGYLYQAQEEPLDEFQYLLMLPDTPDTTYHLEFRYAGTKEDILNLLEGPVAYWVGAAIKTSALEEDDEDTLQKVISLFVVENLAANVTEETDNQRTKLLGTWDCDFSDFPEYGNAKMYIVLSADGTGKTYADFTGNGKPSLVAEYTFFAYDPDKTDRKEAGTYIAMNPAEETVTPGEYEITRINGKTALVFTSNEGVITYYLRNEHPSGGGSGSGAVVAPSYNIAVSSDLTNGSVTASAEKAKKDETVTLTVVPAEGYQAESVTAKDKSGNEVQVKDNGDGTYTFTMPASDVTVEASFKEKAAESTPEPAPSDTHENCPSEPFKDVDVSLWYHEGIDYAIENGLMNGVAADQFAPDVTTTRAMIVTILYRLEGEPATEASSFKDLEAGSWYEAAVNWAASNEIVNGYSADEFGPSDIITREQMAAILYRYADYKGVDVTGRADLSRYTDSSVVSDWATDAMVWAVNAELINGMTETTLVPQGGATRAQSATLLMRLCENVLK